MSTSTGRLKKEPSTPERHFVCDRSRKLLGDWFCELCRRAKLRGLVLEPLNSQEERILSYSRFYRL